MDMEHVFSIALTGRKAQDMGFMHKTHLLPCFIRYQLVLLVCNHLSVLSHSPSLLASLVSSIETFSGWLGWTCLGISTEALLQLRGCFCAMKGGPGFGQWERQGYCACFMVFWSLRIPTLYSSRKEDGWYLFLFPFGRLPVTPGAQPH